MQQIRRRHVFYLAGLDPRGAKFYRRLYARQAALQQPVNGCEYKVSALNQNDPLAPFWDVETRESSGATVETRYHYLRWDDLLQAHWPPSDLRALLGCLSFLIHGHFNGLGKGIWHHAKRYSIVAHIPFFWTILTLLLSSGLAWLVWMIGFGVFGSSVVSTAPDQFLHLRSGLIVAAVGAVAAAVIYMAVRYARRLQIFWLARAGIFVHQWGLGRDPLLEQRWSILGSKMLQTIHDHDADEYIVVGHCAGSAVAVAVTSYMLERHKKMASSEILDARLKRVHLLTLGQIVPVLTLYKTAMLFREQLTTVARSSIAWFDLNSPHDALSCGLAGPLAASELSQSPAVLPLSRSARFDHMMTTEQHDDLKKDIFQMHFQYLMATKFPVFNDYFSLTAGSRSLPERFGRLS